MTNRTTSAVCWQAGATAGSAEALTMILAHCQKW